MAKKFKRGKRITNIRDLLDALARNEYVYYRDRVKHPAVMKQMTVSFLELEVKQGAFRFAKLKINPEPGEKYDESAE